MQYVSEEVDEDIPIMTFDSRQEFDQYAEIFAREPVGLLERQMYRFVVFHLDRESRSGVLVVLSHLISDAWTFGLMANQIDVAYRGLAGETDEALPETRKRFAMRPRNNILRLRAMKKIRNTGMRNILPVLRSAL